MLRDIVGTFLDTLTEREFDGPLLALLASRGFTDVHFIHGQFEFGKDVLAKRADPDTGELRQYAIQSKAGDLGMHAWRDVRPQLDECGYNTLGHPAFDASLPRVAVLVTTGRLKGGAPSDVAEYKKAAAGRGLADVEVWEKPDIVDWMCDDPVVGVAGQGVEGPLLAIYLSVLDKGITDRRIEAYARGWLPPSGRSATAALEAAILVNALTRQRRLDLAVGVALQLFRAASQDDAVSSDGLAAAARRLLLDLTAQMLDQVEPLLEAPLDLARGVVSQFAYVTYPVVCCRLAEACALSLAIVRESDPQQALRFETSLLALAHQPGAARPPSDLFAASVIATTVMLSTVGREAAVTYLRRVARWLLDRHDDALAGLGLASLAEDEEATAARLLGGSLASTTQERRTSSYLATAVMDLALFLGEAGLYESLRANLNALRIIPEATAADESVAHWARAGADVWPHPRVDFGAWDEQVAVEPAGANVDPVSALLLTASCRSRHYPKQWPAPVTEH